MGLWFPTQPDRSNPTPEELQTNQRYLDDIGQGFVPKVLEDMIRAKSEVPANQQVPIALDDKTKETYVPPFQNFSGSGNTLGGNKSCANFLQGVGAAELSLNEGEDKTTIQVVKGRERKKVKINLSATIGQLYQHVLFIFKLLGDIKLVVPGSPAKV